MIDELPVDAWRTLDRTNPAPTFFARPAWAQALATAMPALRPAPLRARIDGRTFILPTVYAQRRRSPFREYVGFPLGGYTCVLTEGGGLAPAAAAADVIASLAARVDGLRIFPWPLAPVAGIDAGGSAHETAVIDCSDGFAAVMARMRGVTRRMAEQARRRGVICERAPASELPAYYALLEGTSARWSAGKPTISYPLVEAVLLHGGEDAQLWFARADGRPIAGGVVLFGAQELFFWSAAMDREAAAYRPSNALNVALLRTACERGVRWYNLGANAGLAGVERFKHDLGAASVAYREVQARGALLGWYERARRFVSAGRAC